MAGGYDGSIRIDSSIDERGFNLGIKSMMGSLKGLAAAIGLAFGVGAVVNFGRTAVSAASELAAALTGLRSVLDGTGKSFEAGKKFIDSYIKDGLIPATNAIIAYKNLALRGYDDTQIQKVLLALKDSASFGRQAGRTMGEAIQMATEGLKNENSILVDNAGVTKNVSKMWEDYAKSIGTSVQALTQQQKIQAEVNGVLAETRFQTGDAGKLAGGYAGLVAGLSTSFYNLKVAIGNAIIPVLSAIIPYIKAVIDWFVVLFNTVARVIALFFNVEISAADTAASAGGLADSTGTAADNAGDLAGNTKKAEKAAKGALAAFDELNVLQMDSGTDGAGAGGLPAPGGSPVGGVVIGDPKDLIPDELMARIQAFKDYLATLFAPAIAAFEKFKTAVIALGGTIWDGIKWAWENILKPLGEWAITNLLPAFIDLFTAAINLLNAALIALAPLGQWLFDNFLKPAAEWTGRAILDALKWLVDRLNDIAKWITENPKAFQTLVMLFASFAVAIWLVNAAIAVWTLVSTIAAGASLLLAGGIGAIFTPIVIVILVIGALIATILILIAYWPEITAAAQLAWEWIKKTWSQAGPWFQTAVITPVRNWFNQAWLDIKNWAVTAWNNIKLAWAGAKQWFTDTVIDPIKKGFNTALDAIKERWETTFNGIKSFVKGVVNGIIGIINAMIRGIVEGINGIVTALNGFKFTIPAWIPGIGGQDFGLNLSYINAPQIPYLATGAVIPANSQFLAMLGDQKSGRNLEAPEALIRQIVREETAQGEDIEISFEGSMGELIRLLKPHIKRESKRKGGSLVISGASS